MKQSKNEYATPLFFQMIIKNNANYLQTLIEQGTDITLKYAEKNGLQFAAYLRHWDCVETILQHSFTKNHLSSRKYLGSIGQVMLWAARENQQKIIELIFELIEKNISKYGKFITNNILFSSKNILWKDENGYTALHWAVHNNNPEICKLLVNNSESQSGLTLLKADSRVCRARAQDKYTPYELALSLQYIDCAKEIVKGMSLEYIIDRTSDESLWKTLFLGIEPGFIKSGYYPGAPMALYEGVFGGFEKILSQKKKMIFAVILTQSTESKKTILASMFDKKSMFCQYFSMVEDQNYFNKAAKILSEYEKIEVDITLDNTTKSSSQSENISFFNPEKTFPESVLMIKEMDGFKTAKYQLEKQKKILDTANPAFFTTVSAPDLSYCRKKNEEEFVIKKAVFCQKK